MKIKRGEVYLIKMDTYVANAVVIQNNKGNYFSPTTIIYVPDNSYIGTIDKTRMVRFMRKLNKEEMKKIEIEMNKTLFGVAI